MKQTIKILVILLILLLWSIFINAQRTDTIRYTIKQEHFKCKNIVCEQKETDEEEKLPMLYIDKTIIDKRNHKVYIFTSYHFNWRDESGLGWQITIPNKKKKICYQ